MLSRLLPVAAALWAAPAFAGDFTVLPTRVNLSPHGHTALVTLHNTGTEELRFQVSAFRWEQTAESDMALTPTTDLVVFPSLLTLAPGESRRIRVGTRGDAGETEGTFRLSVEELPPVAEPGSTRGIRVLTRASVPVFAAPSQARLGGTLAGAHVTHGSLLADASNEGNVHWMLEEVRATAHYTDGSGSFTAATRGWYVLPGHTRRVALDVPFEQCVRLDHIDLRAVTDHGEWSASTSVSPADCQH
jgi:fimbrial chaperone protein